MLKNRNSRTMAATKKWNLTRFADDGSPTVVTGLSDTQARRALSALVTGDDDAVAQLTSQTSTTRVKRAA
jgi:hypothetical protein